MGFRDLAKAAARSPIHDRHKAAVKRALEKRKKQLQDALDAVEEGLDHLSGSSGPGRAKKR
jgi:hypothetical protein